MLRELLAIGLLGVAAYALCWIAAGPVVIVLILRCRRRYGP